MTLVNKTEVYSVVMWHGMRRHGLGHVIIRAETRVAPDPETGGNIKVLLDSIVTDRITLRPGTQVYPYTCNKRIARGKCPILSVYNPVV